MNWLKKLFSKKQVKEEIKKEWKKIKETDSITKVRGRVANVKIFFTNDKVFLCSFKEEVIPYEKHKRPNWLDWFINHPQNTNDVTLKGQTFLTDLYNWDCHPNWLKDFKDRSTLQFKYGDIQYSFASEFIKSIEIEELEGSYLELREKLIEFEYLSIS